VGSARAISRCLPASRLGSFRPRKSVRSSAAMPGSARVARLCRSRSAMWISVRIALPGRHRSIGGSARRSGRRTAASRFDCQSLLFLGGHALDAARAFALIVTPDAARTDLTARRNGKAPSLVVRRGYICPVAPEPRRLRHGIGAFSAEGTQRSGSTASIVRQRVRARDPREPALPGIQSATGRNRRQRFWLVSAGFAVTPFATGCERLQARGSIMVRNAMKEGLPRSDAPRVLERRREAPRNVVRRFGSQPQASRLSLARR
jgi:hypothetical protein